MIPKNLKANIPLKQVWEYDEGVNAELWVRIKRLAKSDNTERLLGQLTAIKESKLLDTQEYDCLLNVALTSSISEGKTKTSQALLEYGADPAPYESLALRLAASLGQEEIVLMCIEKGANPTIGGNMILDLAISHKQVNSINILLKHFNGNQQKPTPKELLNSSAKAMGNSMPEIAEKILDLLSTKEIQGELKKSLVGKNDRNENNKNTYMSIDMQNLAKNIITKRRKKSLEKVIEFEDSNEIVV